jgi:hypothetical protein
VPERLLSLLDKAKAYPLFQKDHPDALAGVLHAAPNATNYYDNFQVVARDVWRFEEEDTLIFRIDLENTSDRTIYYKPQDLAIRLEDRIYTQSLADASGVMPAKSTTPAFFAITGNGTGGRNNLAPDNKGNVLVVRVDGQREDDMRLNDELSKALDALERRRLLNLLWPLFPSRAYLALINNAP